MQTYAYKQQPIHERNGFYARDFPDNSECFKECYRVNWQEHNGFDKMVYGQNDIRQTSDMEKTVRTKWYAQISNNYLYKIQLN